MSNYYPGFTFETATTIAGVQHPKGRGFQIHPQRCKLDSQVWSDVGNPGRFGQWQDNVAGCYCS